MTSNFALGRRKEEELAASLDEIESSIEELKNELPKINDPRLQSAAGSIVRTGALLFTVHRPQPKPTIADDLAGLMSALTTFRVPARDEVLGRTVSLDRLRKSKGLLFAALSDALDAAESLGIRPVRPSLRRDVSAELPRVELDDLLHGLLQRLSQIETSLDSLNSTKELPPQSAQQRALINFYVGAMRLEADIAKLHLQVGDSTINLDGLARSVEVMAELTRDFVETVRAWTAWLAREIVERTYIVRRQVRRFASGIKASILWAVRRKRVRQLTQSSRSDALKRTVETLSDSSDAVSEHDDNLVGNRSNGGSTSQKVLEILPFLRRYARALAGNLTAGDAHVAATLETLIVTPSLIDSGSTPRVALYRLLSNLYNSEVPSTNEQNGVTAQLSAMYQLAPLERQAFLLIALEGFSPEEGAEVLGVDAQRFNDLIGRAGRGLAGEVATDVLIIEPDVSVAEKLKDLMESLGHRVLTVASTRAEAIRIAQATPPGLILAETTLADGQTGLAAVNEILKSHAVPTIFITAYPEVFLTGDRPEPAFLIAKPFELTVVSAVVSQALFFGRRAQSRMAR